MLNELSEEIKKTLKEGDKFKLSVLRMLKSALQNETINKKSDLNEEEFIAVVKKQVKIRKESLAEFEKYGKLDACVDLKKEIEILSNYMPEELSLEDTNKAIDKMFEELKPEGIRDMGKCMKYASDNIKNADMTIVSKIIKERLS